MLNKFKWYKVQLIPSLTTGEVINVGVVVSPEGKNEFKLSLVKQLDKIKYYFGSKVIDNTMLAFEIIDNIISNEFSGDDVDLDQIKITKQGFAFSIDSDSLLSQLMNQTVSAHQENIIDNGVANENWHNISMMNSCKKYNYNDDLLYHRVHCEVKILNTHFNEPGGSIDMCKFNLKWKNGINTNTSEYSSMVK